MEIVLISLGKFIYLVKVDYNLDLSKNLRNYYNLLKKIQKTQLHINFIQTCINHHVLLQFSKFKCANKQLNESQLAIDLRQQLTIKELGSKRKLILKLNKNKNKLYLKLFDLKFDDEQLFNRISNRDIESLTEKIKERHSKKLFNLGVILRTNLIDRLVNKSRNKTHESTEQFNNKQIVFNLSKRKLSSTELSVLSKGLKYGIKNKKINEFELLTRF